MLSYLLLHFQAGLEDYHFSRWDRDYLIGARISTCAALSLLYLKDSEITQLYLLSSGECLNNAIKGLLHYLLYIYLF